jgi:uncharacterized membrane protein
MFNYIVAYAVTAIVFISMDFAWLSFAMDKLYRPRLGSLLLSKPNLSIGALFYLLYIIGIVLLSVMPAVKQHSWLSALWSGALLGFVAYGTYDVTNLATLKNWSATVSAIDMIWGGIVTGVAALAAYFVVSLLSAR